MIKMICPECKSKMKDCTDIFANKNTNYECNFCNASLEISSAYKIIGELLPSFILIIMIIIRNSFNLTIYERFFVQPIAVTVTIIIAYYIYIGLYPAKLKLKPKSE